MLRRRRSLRSTVCVVLMGSTAADGTCFHCINEQMRISELLRPKFGARDDNTRPELGQSPQVRGEFVQHADTAMRSRVAHPDALVDSHARPGYALHVGHGRLAIDIGTVSPALLDNAEHHPLTVLQIFRSLFDDPLDQRRHHRSRPDQAKPTTSSVEADDIIGRPDRPSSSVAPNRTSIKWESATAGRRSGLWRGSVC